MDLSDHDVISSSSLDFLEHTENQEKKKKKKEVLY